MIEETDLLGNAGAAFSEDRRYRYRLWRRWDETRPSLVFVMLNPSTADAAVTDRTVDRCIGFAKADGAGGLHVLNLFAYRATDPAELYRTDDPIGDENDWALGEAVTQRDRLVVAWGAHPLAVERGAWFKGLARKAGCRLYSLGETAAGAPRHPLYIAGGTPLRRWPA